MRVVVNYRLMAQLPISEEIGWDSFRITLQQLGISARLYSQVSMVILILK